MINILVASDAILILFMFPEKKHSFPKRVTQSAISVVQRVSWSSKATIKISLISQIKAFSVRKSLEYLYGDSTSKSFQKNRSECDQGEAIADSTYHVHHHHNCRKVSEDTPDWWKSSYKYYYRSNLPSYKTDPFNSYRTIK